MTCSTETGRLGHKETSGAGTQYHWLPPDDCSTDVIELAPGGEKAGGRCALWSILESGIVEQQALVVIADDNDSVRQVGLPVVKE